MLAEITFLREESIDRIGLIFFFSLIFSFASMNIWFYRKTNISINVIILWWVWFFTFNWMIFVRLFIRFSIIGNRIVKIIHLTCIRFIFKINNFLIETDGTIAIFKIILKESLLFCTIVFTRTLIHFFLLVVDFSFFSLAFSHDILYFIGN